MFIFKKIYNLFFIILTTLKNNFLVNLFPVSDPIFLKMGNANVQHSPPKDIPLKEEVSKGNYSLKIAK